jgi:hypothetical protein
MFRVERCGPQNTHLICPEAPAGPPATTTVTSTRPLPGGSSASPKPTPTAADIGFRDDERWTRPLVKNLSLPSLLKIPSLLFAGSACAPRVLAGAQPPAPKPRRRKPISISIPTLTIIVSLFCPPSLAPLAAPTPSSFACSSTTLIARARSTSALQVS